TGHVNKTTVAELETLVRESGFTPAQRTTLYEIVRVSPGPEALDHLPDDVPLFVESLRELPAEYPATLEGEESGAPGTSLPILPHERGAFSRRRTGGGPPCTMRLRAPRPRDAIPATEPTGPRECCARAAGADPRVERPGARRGVRRLARGAGRRPAPARRPR